MAKLFRNEKKIINNGVEKANSNSSRVKLDIALIVLNQDKEKGKELMQDYYNNIADKTSHRNYVKELAERFGIILKD